MELAGCTRPVLALQELGVDHASRAQELTVYENVYFSARLRLAPNTGLLETATRVETVLTLALQESVLICWLEEGHIHKARESRGRLARKSVH